MLSKRRFGLPINAPGPTLTSDRHSARELEEACFEVSLAARHYEAADPTKRLVARALEARWNTVLERVKDLEERIAHHHTAAASRPKIDRAGLMALARDLPAAWNAPGTDARTSSELHTSLSTKS